MENIQFRKSKNVIIFTYTKDKTERKNKKLSFVLQSRTVTEKDKKRVYNG